MANKVRKLSIEGLKRIIAEEKARMDSVEKRAKRTREVDAEDYADTLENDVDHYKGLKETEFKLTRRLAEVRRRKFQLARKIKTNRSR